MGITITGPKDGFNFRTKEERAIRQWLSKPEPMPSACGCMGPQLLNPEDEKLPWQERQFAKTEPVCPCAMAWVELVDSEYFQISENRTPDGITHTATSLGPVGGPYSCDRYSRTKCTSC